MTTYNRVKVNGLDVFYREAGPKDADTIVLLHGFPSSHMFRDLIPQLAARFHVVAPDYIGFGHSQQPAARDFSYTFHTLSEHVEKLLFEELHLTKFAIYVQDYGAPIGFRIASGHPEAIQAIIVQNGNAYAEGLSPAWEPLRALWTNRNQDTEHSVRAFLTADTTRFQYRHGARDPARISPDAYTLDQFFLDRPGNDAAQLDLFEDYASNLPLYSHWQAYFRKHQPPTLIVWGQNDPFFTIDGAMAYQRDLPQAELHLLDGGHFALEEHSEQIAALMQQFLAKNRTAASSTQDTTIVLVHAAWFDGSSWNKVTSELQRRGYRVAAAQIPLTSLSEDIAAVRRLLGKQAGPVVLVGHSYGGAVVTAAGADDEKVKALVYIAAIVPDEGETVGQLFGRVAPHPQAPKLQPDSAGFLSLKADAFRDAVAPDASVEERALMAAAQKPIALKCLAEPLGKPAWKQKPSWFLIAENDRMVSPDTQRFTAEKIHARVLALPVDHAPLASRPGAVADLIEQAAQSTALRS